ncbi:unnamed protein product [Acanthosepion pharaonis]|uniref:Uncharacterized protein n=1 Tax=Acanthosepion pharaonis TaxID=158019 RepID=A0A812E8K0_ACAPH|nr:unnamed protein product [Sepia pharaonis]
MPLFIFLSYFFPFFIFCPILPRYFIPSSILHSSYIFYFSPFSFFFLAYFHFFLARLYFFRHNFFFLLFLLLLFTSCAFIISLFFLFPFAGIFAAFNSKLRSPLPFCIILLSRHSSCLYFSHFFSSIFHLSYSFSSLIIPFFFSTAVFLNHHFLVLRFHVPFLAFLPPLTSFLSSSYSLYFFSLYHVYFVLHTILVSAFYMNFFK